MSETPSPLPAAAPMSGWVHTHPMHAGATLHLVNVHDREAHRISAELPPGLRIAWVLEGQADIGYGSRRITMPAAPARVHMVSIARQESFVRHARPGGREAAVSLCLTPEWLDAMELGGIPPGEHLRHRAWAGAPELHGVLRSLLSPPPATPQVQRLHREGCFQLLAGHALRALAQPGGAARPLPAHRRRQVEGIVHLIDSGAADGMGLAEIARSAHMSVATMQRHFQQVHGFGVFEYLRRHRLRQAWRAIVELGLDIETAAWQAGYQHASNFSTAFRRQFGVSPAQARRR
jgi:AraC-like DNA-binding protein